MRSTQPWEDIFKMNVSHAAGFLSKTIQESVEHCKPRRELREWKSIHPWLTAETEIPVKETKPRGRNAGGERRGPEVQRKDPGRLP